MDRLTSLQTFVRVVELGGFSAAGRRLNMSVTMVSNHVQGLENRLGVRLLNRTTRRVSLTEIGRAYHERLSHILMDLEEADGVAGALQATPQGVLRLHTSHALLRLLTPVVSEYLALYPGVNLDLAAGDRFLDLVEHGFDLAITAVPPPESSVIVKRLTPWRHVLSCAPSYLEARDAPIRPADLAHHNCLRYAFYPTGDEWRFTGPDGEPHAVRVSGNLMTNSGVLLRSQMLSGQGVFMAPAFLIADDLAAGRIVRLLPGYKPLGYAIHAVYPHQRHVSTKVRRFIDLIAERFGEHRRWMDPDEPS
jgi:DNA-binding transcriptional LysR family regulator